MTEEHDVSTDEATTEHEEVRRGGQRVIVVNSQPATSPSERLPRRLRSLGSVSAHATDPVSVDSRPRRRSSGNALMGLISTLLPLSLIAGGITVLNSRTAILTWSGILAGLLLVGLVMAWRGLGPRGRDGRGGVWFGRAVGIVGGGLVAVKLLLDKVLPLL